MFMICCGDVIIDMSFSVKCVFKKHKTTIRHFYWNCIVRSFVRGMELSWVEFYCYFSDVETHEFCEVNNFLISCWSAATTIINGIDGGAR